MSSDAFFFPRDKGGRLHLHQPFPKAEPFPADQATVPALVIIHCCSYHHVYQTLSMTAVSNIDG